MKEEKVQKIKKQIAYTIEKLQSLMNDLYLAAYDAGYDKGMQEEIDSQQDA